MILVLGGNGFVGQHLARALLDAGERVIVTTNSRTAMPILLADAVEAGNVIVESVDLTDAFSVMVVMTKHRPRIVMDVSGHPPKALRAGRDVAVRTASLLNILEAARITEVARVVLMSSMDVYWGLETSQSPYIETMDVPLLEHDDHFIVQSWVKKSLEVIGNLYRRQEKMDIVFVRASGIYGPLYRTFMNVPSRLARAAARGIPAFEDGARLPAAEAGYDQVYVKDAAVGLAVVALAQKLQHPAYNIGAGRVPNYGEFAAAAMRAESSFTISLPTNAAQDPFARGPMDGRWMSIDRARAELGYQPKFETNEAMHDYVAWLRDHEC